MIQLNDITFGYKRRGNPVFSHFSMNLEPDSIYGLLGKNGAGKSTLLYLMCGLLRPQSGEALFNGKSVVERRPEILEDIFIVPEEFELPPLKLSTYVKINAPFYPHFSEELLSQCLQDFELPEDINLGGLSMGQKKKAFIAFAIATNTRLLLMDEPTNGLDIQRHASAASWRGRCVKTAPSSSQPIRCATLMPCSTMWQWWTIQKSCSTLPRPTSLRAWCLNNGLPAKTPAMRSMHSPT